MSCVPDPECSVEDDYDSNPISSETNTADENKAIDNKKLIKVLNYLLKKNKQQQQHHQQQQETSFDK